MKLNGELNNRKILIGLFIVALLWLANVVYFMQHQLKEPFFMKHYYELSMFNELEFNIYYLVNRDDNTSVVSLEIPGCRTRYFEENELNTYKYYKMKKITIKLNKADIEDITKLKQISFQKIIVRFNNNKRETINIGRVVINLENDIKPFLDWGSAASSSDNSGYTDFRIEDPVLIKGISHAFAGSLADVLNIKINGKTLDTDALPLKVDYGMRMDYAFIFNKENDLRKYNFYQIHAKMLLQKNDGSTGSVRYLMHYDPYLDSSAISKLVKKGWD